MTPNSANRNAISLAGGAPLDRRRFIKLSLTACACWAAAAAPLALGGCSGSKGEEWLQQDPQERTLFVFDTVVTLRAYCSQELMDEVAERCSYFEEHFSRTVEGSDVWNINHAGGQPVEVAEETAELISRSLEYCERSGGLFDITIGAVSSLWDFAEGVRPDDAQVQAALPHIDYRGVSVEGTTVTLSDPEAMIDLGGTAKGYIADSLAQQLRDGGCLSALINLGGNVYVLGTKPDGSDWNVGVQDPNGADQDVVASCAAHDASVVTSGLYERCFTQGGTEYYHILDPRTGYPAQTDLESSSVLCASSLDGDAYATWMFLLGHDAALELLEETDGLEGLVVSSAGAVTQTSAAAFALL